MPEFGILSNIEHRKYITVGAVDFKIKGWILSGPGFWKGLMGETASETSATVICSAVMLGGIDSVGMGGLSAGGKLTEESAVQFVPTEEKWRLNASAMTAGEDVVSSLIRKEGH